MRKLLFIVALLLASCAMPNAPVVSPTSPPAPDSCNVFLVDSAWNVVRSDTLAAKSITSTVALEAERDTWNAGHYDDQWRLIVGELPPVAKAPAARVVVIETTLNGIISDEMVPRSELAAVRSEIRATLKSGQALYIDRDPPPPVHVPTPYEKWALYLVAKDGRILYEEHMPDEVSYQDRRRIYEMQAQADGNGEYVVAGRLYESPKGAR